MFVDAPQLRGPASGKPDFPTSIPKIFFAFVKIGFIFRCRVLLRNRELTEIMRAILTSLLVTSSCLLTGCGALRSIEQWKCDNLGMCHFGVKPSQANWGSPVAPPANCQTPACGTPDCNNSGGVMLSTPQPADLHLLPSSDQFTP